MRVAIILVIVWMALFSSSSEAIEISGTRSDICAMCECGRPGSKRSITFSATILGGHVTTVAGQVIKFNRVYVNDGNGYSTITGIFTVPEAGLYQFSWDVLKYTGSGLDVDFYVNNNLTHTSWMPGYKGYEARTGILFLHMRSGDRVYLKTRHGGQKLHGSGKNNAGYCLFNGIRL